MEKEKYTDEQIDAFLEKVGIELLPFQRELFKSLVNTEEGRYILMPPRYGRTFMMEMMDKFYKEMRGE